MTSLYLGFDMYNHHKGVFFDRYDRDDVVTYHGGLLDKLAKLDETSFTPSTPCPSVVHGEKKYIQVYHDELKFYSKPDQTR